MKRKKIEDELICKMYICDFDISRTHVCILMQELCFEFKET